jgi:hypothetical protein
MAERDYTVSIVRLEDSEAIVVKWTGLLNTDTGKPYVMPYFSEKTVQVEGTFGTGGKCAIQGSLMISTPTFQTLNDPQGNVLEIAAAKIEALLENSYQIRPNIIAGDGATSLTCYLLLVGKRLA